MMANSAETTPVPPPRKSSFISEVVVEMKKVTWPTLPEAWRLTTVVLAVIVAVAAYVGLIDFVLSFVFNRLHVIK